MPTKVLIGTFLLHTSDMKNRLLERIDQTNELLMQLICERGRQAAAEVSQQFSDMYDTLQEQPKDIEKLTEMANFLASLPERSDELSRQITEMVSHYDMLEALGRDVPAADYSARWEAYHCPLRLHVKQARAT